MPEAEVDFCGHATIALGAALAERYEYGTYWLTLSKGKISVDGSEDGDHFRAVLLSRRARSAPI